MRVVIVKPLDRSVVPGLAVLIEYELEETRVRLIMGGYVVAVDGKIVGSLMPGYPEISVGQERSDLFWYYTPDSISAESHGAKSTSLQDLFCTLDKRGLEHIENLRLMDPKKDMHLSFVLISDLSSINARMGDFTHGAPVDDRYPVMSTHGQGDRSHPNLQILVSPNQMLCEVRRSVTRLSHTIKANDWLYDFAPVLGLGQFLVVEILKPDIDMAKPSELTAEVEEFFNRLERAREIVDQMDKDLQCGEWGNVVEESRKFWELFVQKSGQVNVQGFIKRLIADTTGLEEDKSQKLITGIGSLYSYASDLHHSVDDSGVKNVFVGGKEDAYLTYSLAASFLNLIVSKFKWSLRSKEENR